MCYNRALSKLARQLFPDVIGNCYVEEEISDAPPLFDEPKSHTVEHHHTDRSVITKEQADELDALIGDDNDYRTTVLNFIKKKFDADSLEEMPVYMVRS